LTQFLVSSIWIAGPGNHILIFTSRGLDLINRNESMHFKQILVVKETRENEERVALVPQSVAILVKQGFQVLVEKDAGFQAGFENKDYIDSGAEIFELNSSGFPPNSFIVRVLCPSKERKLMENKLFHENTAMLGFLFPFVADNHIATWQALKLTTLSFDLFKSISTADPKNAQAAMSRIAGRLAFLDALEHYSGDKPRLTVIGAGSAGISSAFEAIKQGVPVQVFGRKESQRAKLEAAGITYYVLPEVEEKQIDFIKPYLAEETIVITAARTPGKKAPLLIDETSLRFLPSNAVVVDLAISNGGNVAGSKHDQVIHLDTGVCLLNVSGYPKKEPKTSSEIYANCVMNLLREILSPQGELSFENKLIQEIWVTHDGRRHDSLGVCIPIVGALEYI
jgi:NAD(P) transhydrogenase subunit alpha